jgi:predicted PolB exonuclease-like 3'-5' exonuclease
MIIQKKILNNTLFIDIETVSATAHFEDLSEEMQSLWIKKSQKFKVDKDREVTPNLAADLYREKSGIFAEFAKIACISVGYLSNEKQKETSLRLKSFAGEEKELLEEFNDLLNNHYDRLDEHYLCGHNIKEFDVPFLCRRCVVNGLELPRLLNISGKKPWQVAHLLDTMELWRFGDYKNYTSLALLAGTLGIPSPKDDIDGSMVGHVYWEEDDIDRIVTYCEKDVATVAQVVMKFAGMDLIAVDKIEVV